MRKQQIFACARVSKIQGLILLGADGEEIQMCAQPILKRAKERERKRESYQKRAGDKKWHIWPLMEPHLAKGERISLSLLLFSLDPQGEVSV
jgi:hypothetical protein